LLAPVVNTYIGYIIFLADVLGEVSLLLMCMCVCSSLSYDSQKIPFAGAGRSH